MKIEEPLSLKGKRILIAVTGSIAAVKTPSLVSNLIKAGAEVRCVVTPSAANLVSPLSLATLSRNHCFQDKDQWSPDQAKPLHIDLSEWAEILVVAPLSASTLARWTQGLAEGLVASVLLAFERPVLAAAAMNTGMWKNPIIQKNWAALKTNPQILTLEPESGLLACDRFGDGRMANPDLIQFAISSALLQINNFGKLKKDFFGQRLLITAGGTSEKLDPARLLTNRSSGRMGVFLAQAARTRGAIVDLIHGSLALPTSYLEGLNTYPVTNAAEMQGFLAQLQPSSAVIAMAAAVADLRKIEGGSRSKFSKEQLLASMGNGFEKVPDLLSEIVRRKSNSQLIVGFTALSGSDDQLKTVGEAKRLQKGCDLMMANPIDRPGQGFESNLNGGFLLGPKGSIKNFPIQSKLLLSHELLDAIRALQVNISDSS